MAIKRIPASAIHAGQPYRDGEIITGTMVNEVVKVLKDGVNYNKFFIDAMFAGTTEEAIVIGVPKGTLNTTAEDIVQLEDFITANGITVADGDKAFVFRCIYGNVDDPTEITGVQALNYYKYVTNAWVHQYAVSMDTFIQGLSSDFDNYDEVVTLADDDLFIVKDVSASLPKKINKLNMKETLGVNANAQNITDMKDGTDAFSEILLGTAQIRYNSTKKIVEQVFDDGTTMEVGLELWAIARNEDTTILKNGEVGAVNGVVGQQLSVIHADPSNHLLHFKELGVCTMDANIAVNGTGKITHFGEVNGIPIANFEVTGVPYAENQELYVSVNGKLTNVQPAKPITHIHAGWILRTIGSDANIFVYFVKVPHFDHLSDVIITTPTNGDIPILGSDGIWRNSQRLVTAESEITKIKDGTTTVKKAEQDEDGRRIKTTYATASGVATLLDTKVPKTTKVIGIDLQDDILLTEFKTALGNATQSVAGLLSAEDKTHLDGLVALLASSDGNTIVDTIGEILAIFNNYPEGADLVTVLNGKVDKVAGKGLSENDFTDALKNKLDGLLNGSQYYDKNYIDALKDQNGWESELLTLTPLAPSGTIATATLLLYNSLRLQVKNTSTLFVDTDTIEVSLGVVTGNKILLNGTDVYLEIGATNSTFVAPAGWQLQIVGLKYTDLVASDVATDEVGVSVQNKLDILDNKKANRYIDEPIAELNNHTLREVFEGGNILKDPNFDTNTVWALRPNTTQNISGGINTITATATSTSVGIGQLVPNPSGNTFYTVVRFNSQSSNGLELYIGGVAWTVSSTPNVWNIKSIKGIVASDVTYRIYQSLTIGQSYQLDYAYLINQTSLGISSLTQAQMDYWFNVYQQYKDDNGLKSTVDSLQALKEKDSEIELKVTTIEEAYRKSQNGELTATKQDIENISLGKDVAPAPLQVKVDGGLLEAKQLVTNGNFSDGLTGWSSAGVSATLSANNGILSATGTGNNLIISIYNTTTSNPVAGDKYYTTSKVRNTTTSALQLKLYVGDNTVGSPSPFLVANQASPVQNTWYYLSGISVITTQAGYIRSYLTNEYADASTANGKVMEVDYVYLFNISTLIANKTYSPLYNKTFDLMSDAEIKAQMDLWVQNGTLPNDNVLAVGMNKRVRSVGKNLISSLWEIGSITNGVNSSSSTSARTVDFIKIKPNTAYTVGQNGVAKTVNYVYYDINKNFISNATASTATSPSNSYYIRLWFSTGYDNTTNFQLELGSTATTYAPYANTDLYLQANKVGYKLPNGVADTVEYRNGKYYYVQRVQRYVIQASDISSLTTTQTGHDIANFATINPLPRYPLDSGAGAGVGILYTALNSGFTYLARFDGTEQYGHYTNSSGQVRFVFPKGTYADLASAQTALTGTVVYYQLATPIETEILAFGNAQGLSGGSVYIDDVMADSNLYTHRYDIENTAYPIKSLDRIVKINADGSQTELAVSSAIIAGDGLSFTHPSLVANDIVWVSYAYNVANLFKSNTYVTYYEAEDDLRFPATLLKQGATTKPDFDYTNVGLLFPQNNATEIIYIVAQLPHDRVPDSPLEPHVHCRLSGAGQPVMKIDYKIYNPSQTAIPASFTTYTMNVNTATWSSGTISNMIYGSAPISGVGYGNSAIMIIKLYRDDNVYTGDLLVDEFDIHYIRRSI